MMGPGSHNAPGTAVLATDAEREELRQFKELMGQVKGKGSKEAAVAIARGVKVAANEKAKVAATEAAAKKDAETATQQEAMDGLDAQAL